MSDYTGTCSNQKWIDECNTANEFIDYILNKDEKDYVKHKLSMMYGCSFTPFSFKGTIKENDKIYCYTIPYNEIKESK